jgi:hypothetical protein
MLPTALFFARAHRRSLRFAGAFDALTAAAIWDDGSNPDF